MTTRASYTAEFTRAAVRLLEAGEKPAAQIARELGIKRNQLYKWQKEIDKHGEAAFPSKGRHSSTGTLPEEVFRLKKSRIGHHNG